MNTGVLESLRQALSADRVRDDEQTLAAHAADITENPPGRPEFVVFPETVEEVQAVIQIALAHHLPVVPVVANSNLGGLCNPVEGGISLDLTRMNRILEVHPEDLYAVIEPGVTWQQMSDHLAQNHPGLRFAYPLSPPDTGIVPNCLLDGLANFSLQKGSASHWINGLEAVLGDASLLRAGGFTLQGGVPCTSAPFPGLHGLFVSFQGTTGVVTKLSVQLWPEKRLRRRLFLMAYQAEHAFDLARVLAREDVMDDLGVLSLPTGKMLFGEQKPTFRDPAEPEMFLYLDFSANREREIELKLEILDELLAAMRASGGRFDGPLDLADLVRLEPRFEKFARFPTRLDFLLDTKGGGLTWIGTYGPCSRFAEGYRQGAAIMARAGMPPLVVCRVMQGAHFGVLRWITVFDRHDPAEVERVRAQNRELADMAVSLGFFPYKTPQWVWERYADRLDPTFRRLTHALRRELDPHGILNPGHCVL